MADDGFGLSFAPFAGKQGYGDQGGGQLSPVQEAIQILSLRRPTVVGASAPGPNGLINPNAPVGPVALARRAGWTSPRSWRRC
jgi:hypothetical protein